METMVDKQESIVAAIELLLTTDVDKVQFVQELLSAVGEEQQDILSLFYVAQPGAFIPDTPQGFSVFTSAGGVRTQRERFAYVDEAAYEAALQTGKMTVADPFHKTIDGRDYTVITVFLPVHDARGT